MVAFPIVAGWLCLLFVAVLIALRKPHRNLPPGPRRLPMIGNLLDMPPQDGRNWEHYAKHNELYGPITSLNAFGTTIILLHDLALTQELLEKKAVIASNRPRPFFLTQMCGWGEDIGLIPYNRRLRAIRKHIHSLLGTQTALAKYSDIQDLETRRFLLRVLNDPTRFLEHIKSEAAGIMLKSIYGYTINLEGSDPIIGIVERALADALVAGQPGAWLVDAIPASNIQSLSYLPDWFPGTHFKQVAREIRATERAFSSRPWEFVKHQIAKGTHEPSFVSRLHEEAGGELQGEDAHVTKWAANGLYGGGADTTVSPIMTFFLVMLHQPEIQQKAQDEIDQIVGKERLPALQDRGDLPYTEAVITEVLRFHTVVPEGLPHATTEDCELGGYLIPEGAVIIPNIQLFAHSSDTYLNPGVFNPDRFLGGDPELDPRTFIFGFGRRVCPGQLLANSNLFLALARTLAALDIRKPIDSEGIEYTPPMIFEHGFVSHPAPFEARITPRSEKYRDMILEVERTQPMGKGSAEDMEEVHGG
ncbi:hypothetical protein DOTSEDRAFT_59413 [Dothistroma septosporum NZE10]|uniref:Cytochrome P450 n=1 Tax=Dothistroma septosporum (strain NZE10 / CBS 128990) TaxID=675120 RepID=N1Q5A3_DOTSN|nr:hypothetical protein DOTSEDRAFT_59413 [Dothistroma septosporum NZE10]